MLEYTSENDLREAAHRATFKCICGADVTISSNNTKIKEYLEFLEKRDKDWRKWAEHVEKCMGKEAFDKMQTEKK